MTFQNSILAGTTLVREAISSEGYVQGSTGWTIERDGDAEFNDVNVRGTVSISDSGGTMDLNVDILGQPRIEFTTPNGDQYQITSDNVSMDIGALDNFAGDSSIHVVDELGIVFRSALTGAPSVLFDYNDGYLKAGSYSPWTEEDWQDVTFVNGFGNIGLGFHNVQYKINALGRVEFRGGLLKAGPTANGTVMFTLPAGYRPTTTVGFPAHNLGSAGAVNPGFRVFSNGQVQCFGYTAGTIANTAFSLDGHSFPLEA